MLTLKILLGLSGLIDLAFAVIFVIVSVQSDAWRTEKTVAGRVAMAGIELGFLLKALLALIVILNL